MIDGICRWYFYGFEYPVKIDDKNIRWIINRYPLKKLIRGKIVENRSQSKVVMTIIIVSEMSIFYYCNRINSIKIYLEIK